MKRCGHCGADFDDRIDFCFNDGTPLELAVVTTVPGAPPKRSQSSRFSNALSGIDAPEASSLAFDAPDTSPFSSPDPEPTPVINSPYFQAETTDSIDVPDMVDGDNFAAESKVSIDEVTDVTDLDLGSGAEDDFLNEDLNDLTNEDLGNDFGFMQDTGDLVGDSSDLLFHETPAAPVKSSKLPILIGAAAIVLAIGASISMLSGSDETLLAENEQVRNVNEYEDVGPIAGEIEDVGNNIGEGIDVIVPIEEAPEEELTAEEESVVDEDEEEPISTEQEPEEVVEAQIVSNEPADDEPTMPISLNRPSPVQEPSVPTPPREQAPAPSNPAPVRAAPVTASPWGATQNTVVSATSRVRVQSTPSGAQVLVDGNTMGTTPSDFNIARGPHLMAVEMNGFITYTENVDIQNDSQIIRANLEPVPQSSFEVVVSFYGASGWRVFEANVPLCTIPCSHQLSTGTHQFRVVNDSESWVVTREIQGSYAGASVGVNLQQD